MEKKWMNSLPAKTVAFRQDDQIFLAVNVDVL
jgi:hypothetical protein